MGFFDSLGSAARAVGNMAEKANNEMKEARDEGMYLDNSRLVSRFRSASGARKQGHAAAIRARCERGE